MAIENVGISFDQNGPNTQDGVRLWSFDTIKRTIYIKWHTESGTDWQKSFDVAINYRVVPKGVSGTGNEGYGNWSREFTANIPAERCNPHKESDDPGWWWSYTLNVAGLVGNITNGTVWNYSTRKYDAIHLQIRIKSNYVDGKQDSWGRTYSSRVDTEAWIGYFPEYTMKMLYYAGSNNIAIQYDAPDWERNDDRFEIEEFRQSSDLLGTSKVWGRVVRKGLIVFPLSDLAKMPDYVNTTVTVHMNAAWRTPGESFSYIYGYQKFDNMSTANTPKLVASVDQESATVSIKATDTGDKGVPLNNVTIKMEGGSLAVDQVNISIGSTAVFKYPPLGSKLTFSAIGYGNIGAISNPVRLTTDAIKPKGRNIVDNFEGDGQVAVVYNVTRTITGGREQETVFFAGRSAESAFFGAGIERKISLSGEIIDYSVAGKYRQARSRFAWLEQARRVMVRLTSGRRLYARVTSFSLSDKSDGLASDVNLEFSEVSE